jgi:hypothetical protein
MNVQLFASAVFIPKEVFPAACWFGGSEELS